MDAGLLPVKRFGRAKARLGAELEPEERVRVARALWEDALDLCERVDFLAWWVVTDDPDLVAEASDRGFGAIQDRGEGLNAALTEGIEAVKAAGAASITVLPCDVPLTREDDLRDLLDTGATSDVVVVPSGQDGGTNGLYMAPPDLIRPQFGPASLQAHLTLARRRGYRCAILPLPRLALDIDTPSDVRALLARPPREDGRTAKVLRGLRAWTSGEEPASGD
ncbi:MAG: 2-phospho-L-lactate guanylyltransferase [Actinobacteria bacterium]|jgi:2-phospho-L-lactate guanylyltransferase|nr:2-phospho-L-lactate guanylyltransferase [Actinomycetota bacterium]MDQ3531053.1 2-phospho-L-lactate guanylyltransferase [Actinomycetota bacterium]